MAGTIIGVFPAYADDAAATAGLAIVGVYRVGNALQIRVA